MGQLVLASLVVTGAALIWQEKETGIVGLYNEEEDLFRRDIKQCRPNNHIRGVGPYLAPDEIGIPWDSREHRN